MKRKASKFTKRMVLSHLLVCSSLLFFVGQTVSANEVEAGGVSSNASSTEVLPESDQNNVSEEGSEQTQPSEVGTIKDVSTSLQNV
ncbi:hypothetical protein, partial [Streptococcus suis]